MSLKPSITVSVNITTRRALYTPSAFNAKEYGLNTEEPTEVGVFGLFQVKEDDETDACFVVELPDGRCCHAGVYQIQFIKEEEVDEHEATHCD